MKQCVYRKPVDHIRGVYVHACTNPNGSMRVEKYGMACCPYDERCTKNCPDYDI